VLPADKRFRLKVLDFLGRLRIGPVLVPRPQIRKGLFERPSLGKSLFEKFTHGPYIPCVAELAE